MQTTDMDATWRHHALERFTALLTLCEGNLPAIGGFPPKGSVTRSFHVCQKKHLNQQSSCRLFETLWCDTITRRTSKLSISTIRINVPDFNVNVTADFNLAMIDIPVGILAINIPDQINRNFRPINNDVWCDGIDATKQIFNKCLGLKLNVLNK